MNKPREIALFTDDAEIGERFSEILSTDDGFELHRFDSCLTALNGKAHSIAGEHDVVLFHTSRDSDLDIMAAQRLSAEQPDGKPLIALTAEDTTLAEVRRLTDAGVSDVLPESISAGELSAALARLSPNTEPEAVRPSNKSGKVIAVAKARGGVGATTLAVNLADRLMGYSGVFRKQATKSAVIVDLDLQFGNVGSFLDQGAGEALFSMATDAVVPDDTYVEQALSVTGTGLAVLAAPDRFAPLNALQPAQIEALLTSLKHQFDYVVVDLPPAMVDWVSPVLNMSDKLLLVTDCSVPSVSKARQIIDFFTEENLGLPIEIVVNFENKPMFPSVHHKEAATVLERPLSHWLPNDQSASREALDLGVPLSNAAARSKLARAIGKLATTLATDLSDNMSAGQVVH